LIQALQSSRSKTVGDLAELAGVSRRTVFRDLELLSRAGIPYTYDRETRRYSTERTMLLPPVTLSHAEALALMLAARHLLSDRLMPDESAAASAGLKLEGMLPAVLRNYCGPLLAGMEIRWDPGSHTGSILEIMAMLQSALVNQAKVQLEYDSYFEGSVIKGVLHPYRLTYIHRGWYLIAFSEANSDVRTYKVERMLSVRVLRASYMIDPGFNLDDYFGNAWLMIRGDKSFHAKIRFLKKVAANVDEIAWHKTQRTTYQEDGSLIFEVDVDGIEEISWWILGYGDQAQVLQPRELRELLAERVKRMRAYYTGAELCLTSDGK
jgi:proteasome accessory factor B